MWSIKYEIISIIYYCQLLSYNVVSAIKPLLSFHCNPIDTSLYIYIGLF